MGPNSAEWIHKKGQIVTVNVDLSRTSEVHYIRAIGTTIAKVGSLLDTCSIWIIPSVHTESSVRHLTHRHKS